MHCYNKKRNYLILFLLFFFGKTYTQNQFFSIDTIESRVIVDSLDKTVNDKLKVYRNDTFSSGSRLMPSEYFNKFIHKYFTYLSFDKVEIPPGNSISLKPTSKDTRLLANLTYKRNLYQLFSFGAELDYNENVANVISGANATSNTSFFFNFASLNSGHRKIWYDANKAAVLNARKIKFLEKYQNDIFINYADGYKKLYAAYIKAAALADSLSKIAAPHDTTRLALAQAQNNNAEIESKINALEIYEKDQLGISQMAIDDIVKKLRDTLSAKIEGLELSTEAWTRFQLSWFSGGIKYTNEAYKLYDSLKAFTERTDDFNFDKWNLTLSYNFIRERSKWFNDFYGKGIRSFYFNAAYSLSNDNSYGSIDELDFMSAKISGRNDTANQVQTKMKIRDVSGIVYKKNWAHQLGVNATIFLAKSSLMGFNFGINTVLGKFQKPLYNSKLGVLLRFKDTDDQKSKINFELFLQLNDLADNKDSDKSPWQRKVIGINTAIPFSTIFFK